MKLQVPENFILLAFCTQSRQNFQSTREGRFISPEQGLPKRRARSFCLLFTACSLLIASSSCVKLQRRALQSDQNALPAVQAEATNAPLININTASPIELEKLPGIGRGLSARIVAYRKEYGRFRRAEHLMMVRGISDRRFRALRALITSE
jgi:competence ComEA-like helix-hairpin-helix protein